MNFLSNIGWLIDLGNSNIHNPDGIKSLVNQKTIELKGLGFCHGDRVILNFTNTSDFFISLFALWSIGAVAVPLNENATSNEIESIMKGMNVAGVISGEKKILPSKNKIRSSVTGSFQNDQPCLILMSSGTTGKPKGIEFTFSHLKNRMDNFIKRYEDAYEKTLCILPTSFGHGLIANCLTPLLNGKQLFLTKKFDLEVAINLDEILIQHEITMFSTVPSFWNLLKTTKSPPLGKTSLKQIHCASAVLNSHTYSFIRSWIGSVSFIYHYGLTECGSWVTDCELPVETEKYKMGLVGKALDCEIKIIKSQKEQSGEIFLKCDSMPLFYLNLSGDGSTIRNANDDFLHTKDIGYETNEGLFLLGRQGDFINRGGEKISASEIEQLALDYPEVEMVAVFAIEHQILGETIGLAIQTQNKNFNQGNLKSYLMERLSPSKIPSEILILDKMELSYNGKINKQKLVQKICDLKRTGK